SVTALAVSPDGKLVGTSRSDGTISLWDAATGQVKQTLPGGNTVCALAFSPGGRTVLAGRLAGEGGQKNTGCRAREPTTGQPLGQAFHGPGRVGGVAFSPPDGLTLLTIADQGKTVSRLESPAGRFLGDMLLHQGWVRAVAYSPDGRSILTGGEDRAA